MDKKLDWEGQSVDVLDAIDAMKEALRHHDTERCKACFDMLTDTLDEISRNPEDENYFLREWSRAMLKRRNQNGCSNCHPPVRDDLFKR